MKKTSTRLHAAVVLSLSLIVFACITDPFAGFDMAPQIKKTVRHEASSVFAKPAAPSSGLFAMTSEAEADDGGGAGWGDDDDGLGDFGAAEKRRAAEERRKARREQNKQQRDGKSPEKRSLRAAAVKTNEE